MDELLKRQTDLGCEVGQIRLLHDTYLVRKLRVDATSAGEHGKPIHLPEVFTRKSVRNLVAIKAEVIRASEPFRSTHLQKRIVGWDTAHGDWRYQYLHKTGSIVPPRVQVGEGVIYNGYNVGKVQVEGLDEPLVLIRGIDIECAFPMEAADQIQVGDFAMARTGEVDARGNVH